LGYVIIISSGIALRCSLSISTQVLGMSQSFAFETMGGVFRGNLDKVFGFAYQSVMAGNLQAQEIRIMPRQLLMDQEKRNEMSLLVNKLPHDPWIDSITAFLEAG
jgi:hypothetical protein